MRRRVSATATPWVLDSRPTHAFALSLSTLLLAGSMMQTLIESARAADWIITPSIAARQGFTDNARHATRGNEKADAFTSLTPAISISGLGPRVSLNVSYALTGIHYYDDDELDKISHNLLGGGTAELIDELLYLDARAAIFQQLLDPTSTQSGQDAPIIGQETNDSSNTTTAKTYSLSPYLRNRFGSFADSELRYRFNQFISGAGESTSNTISETLSSGADFTRLRWLAQAIAVDTKGSNNGASSSTNAITGGPARDSSRQMASFSPEYVVSRYLSLLGSVGYERIEDETLADEPNGIIGNAGVRVNPGPRSTFRVLWNHRYEENYFTGDGAYLIGPTTRLDFAYTRDVQTSQSAYEESLSYLGTDEYGNFIDTRSLQGFRLDNYGTGFSNSAYRQERYSLRLTSSLDRDSLSAEVYRQTRESTNALSTQTTNGVTLGWSRPLSPLLGFRFGMSYTDTEFDSITVEGGGTREDQSVRGGPGLNYAISETMSGSLNYNFIYRFSNAPDSNQRENIITVGVRKIF